MAADPSKEEVSPDEFIGVSERNLAIKLDQDAGKSL